MSGYIENRASGASEQSGSPDRILTWQASRAMLPLVSRVAHDLAASNGRLKGMYAELAHLEKHRRSLDWPRRQRRYQLEDEIAAAEAEARSLAAELDGLGVALLDGSCGLVGFPTRVNDRVAFFSWMPGEGELTYWNYAGDHRRRPVPDEWTQPPAVRRPRKSRK